MNREEILDRYRRLRAISTHHHSAALKFLSGPALLAHAKRLGLAVGRTLLADSEEEMILTFDLRQGRPIAALGPLHPSGTAGARLGRGTHARCHACRPLFDLAHRAASHNGRTDPSCQSIAT